MTLTEAYEDMKSKRNLIVSIFQLVIGLLAVAAFVVAALNNENMIKWIITLILAIAFIVFGLLGIIDYKSNKYCGKEVI